MTAEIAIMNKTAIALAADSAVTIGNQKGQKIYNTVNKLFTLSKYHPVGIMIYGSAEFMGIPWESVIKIYRNNLGNDKFNTLQEYTENFIKFLDENNPLFPESEQINYFYGTIVNYFNIIKGNVDEEVSSIIKNNGKIQDTQVQDIVTNVIKKHYEDWEKIAMLSTVPNNYNEKILEKYEKNINEAKEKVFQKLPISETSDKELKKICANLFSKNRFPTGISGIVIAGFGDKDTFPSLTSFVIEAVVNNKLKYRQDKKFEISFVNNAAIVPFAQSEMVSTFMEGIDPFLYKFLEGYLDRLFNKYPENIADTVTQISDAEKIKLKEKLKTVSANIFDDFRKQVKEYRIQHHIRPVIDAVAVLPKDELAAMAESLVNLTSFKRKISMDAETVGGPIDVAVISKGDGFIWIKRKHYFNAELNPYFFANYYSKNQIEKGGKNGSK